MIREFYVFQRSGSPVFHRSYGGGEVDEALLSGFLAAVFSFAKEIGHGGIQTMAMEDTVFVYKISGDLIFAVAVDVGDDEEVARGFLAQVAEEFFREFEGEIGGEHVKPLPSDFFNSVLDSLVKEYNSRLMVKEVFSTPFLTVEGGEAASFDVELAGVFLFLEAIRSQGLKLLRRKEMRITAVANFLWPFWIVPCGEGGNLIVDGIFEDPMTIDFFSPPSFEHIEASLDKEGDPLEVIERIMSFLRKGGERKSFSINSLVGYEYAEELASLLSSARMVRVKGAAVLRPTLRREALERIRGDFMRILEDVRENAERLKRLSGGVVGVAEAYFEMLKRERENVEREYSEKLEKVRREVEDNKVRLEGEKFQKVKELNAWLHEEARKAFLDVEEKIGSLTSLLNGFLKFTSNIGGEACKEVMLEESIGLLRQAVERIDGLRKYMELSQSMLRDAKKRVENVLKEVRRERQLMEKTFRELMLKEQERVSVVEREMRRRILEVERVKETYRKKLRTLYEYLERLLKVQEEDEAKLVKLMVRIFDVEEVQPVYLSIYIAEMAEDGKSRIIVIPPMVLSRRGEPKPSLGLKRGALPINITPVASFLKERFEEHLKNPEFAKGIRDILDMMNILSQKEVELKLYDGLSFLLKNNYISKKDFSSVKANAIELFSEMKRA
ncbi:MAG: hypothetical protein ACTSUS_01935 [Candidatus Freyarchaeota archaeon]